MKKIFKAISDKFTRSKKESQSSDDLTGEFNVPDLQEMEVEDHIPEVETISAPNKVIEALKAPFKKITKYAKSKTGPKEMILEGINTNPASNNQNNKNDISFSERFFSIANRKIIHRYFIISVLASSAFGIGKIIAHFSSGRQTITTTTPNLSNLAKGLSRQDYITIKNKNIFQSSKKSQAIEKPKVKKPVNENLVCEKASKRSSLPIKVINTVVLQDTVKSIASVQIRGGRDLKEIRQGEMLSGMAKLDRITRQRLILKNLTSGQCEYIENNPKDKSAGKVNVLSPKESQTFVKTQPPKEIKNSGNKFKIKKDYLNNKLKNIGEILTQARAVQVNNPDGSLCFNIQEIDPSGIFPSLGIQNNDTICEINGSKITSLNQVMDLFGKIREVDQLELGINRNGTQSVLDYSFD